MQYSSSLWSVLLWWTTYYHSIDIWCSENDVGGIRKIPEILKNVQPITFSSLQNIDGSPKVIIKSQPLVTELSNSRYERRLWTIQMKMARNDWRKTW